MHRLTEYAKQKRGIKEKQAGDMSEEVVRGSERLVTDPLTVEVLAERRV